VIGKRTGCRGVTDVVLMKGNEIRERRYENTVLTYAQQGIVVRATIIARRVANARILPKLCA